MTAHPLQVLMPRARAVWRAITGEVWRFDDYSKHAELVPLSYTLNADGSFNVSWHRASDAKAQIAFYNVAPAGVRDLKRHPPTPGKSKVIDAARVTVENFDGVAERSPTYTGTFGAVTSEENAVSAGLSLAIRNCFTAGNDASPVKNETEITAEAHSDWSKTTGSETSEERSLEDPMITPPGYDIEFWGERKVTSMAGRLTGRGDYTIGGVSIGKHWDHKWHRQKSESSRHWDSFDALVRIVRGGGGDKETLGTHFRLHPAQGAVIAALETKIDAPFEQAYSYDGVTDVRLAQRVLRGPKGED